MSEGQQSEFEGTPVSVDDEPARSMPLFGRRGAKRAAPEPVVAQDLSEADDTEWDEDGDDVPAARTRSKSARRPTIVFLNFLMTGAVFALVGAGGAAIYGKTRFEAPGPVAADTSFVVREGASVSSIATELDRRGLIEDARLFRLAARVLQKDTDIKTGEFAIPAGSSMASIMTELTEGSPIEYRVTIPEGFTVWEAMQRVAAHPELTGDMPEDMPAEGMLAAETVSFARGDSRASVIERLKAIQEERLARAWEARSADAPVDTPNNLLTLASLVEKETAIPSERRDVAAVYSNRIRQNWRLDADPTVIYGVYGGKGLPPGKSITRSDLNDRNLYNTYRMKGLPAGPIAIPGEASLMAAANPSGSKAMFFVADGTGGHIFADTLDQHNANVRKWRAIERGEIPRPERTQRASAEGVEIAPSAERADDTGAVAALAEADVAPDTASAEVGTASPEVGTPAPDMPVPLMNPDR